MAVFFHSHTKGRKRANRSAASDAFGAKLTGTAVVLGVGVMGAVVAGIGVAATVAVTIGEINVRTVGIPMMGNAEKFPPIRAASVAMFRLL